MCPRYSWTCPRLVKLVELRVPASEASGLSTFRSIESKETWYVAFIVKFVDRSKNKVVFLSFSLSSLSWLFAVWWRPGLLSSPDSAARSSLRLSSSSAQLRFLYRHVGLGGSGCIFTGFSVMSTVAQTWGYTSGHHWSSPLLSSSGSAQAVTSRSNHSGSRC